MLKKKKAESNMERLKKVSISKPGVEIDRRRIDASNLNTGNSNMCISWGDPHVTTFAGAKFNNYNLGDRLLLKSRKLKIEVRQRRWGSAAVMVLFAAKVNGIIVEADRPDNFLLNKKRKS